MKKIILFALIILFSGANTLLAEPVIIVNKGTTSASLDNDTIKNIYLGKKSKWDDGQKIVPVALTEGLTHQTFLKTYIKKSPSQFSTYWKQMIFSGKGIPPKTFGTDAEVVEYVSSTIGAIGYIDSETPSSNVTVIK